MYILRQCHNAKKEFTEKVSKEMALAHKMGSQETQVSLPGVKTGHVIQKAPGHGADPRTTFVQTETETGENDKPLVM